MDISEARNNECCDPSHRNGPHSASRIDRSQSLHVYHILDIEMLICGDTMDI